MKRKIYTVIILIVIANMLTACSKEPPNCTDYRTTKKVMEKIWDMFGLDMLEDKELVGMKKEIKEGMKIENILAGAYDKKNKKFSCEGNLTIIVMKGARKIELPVTYTSQLDDKGENIIAVSNISMNDLADAIEMAKMRDEREHPNVEKQTPAPVSNTTSAPVSKPEPVPKVAPAPSPKTVPAPATEAAPEVTPEAAPVPTAPSTEF